MADRGHLNPRRGRLSSRRRGVYFIWFALIGVPVVVFGMILAAEIALTVTVNRAVRLAAESAAVGGAFQFADDGSATLDQPQARLVAQETFAHAIASGAVRGASVVNHWATTQPRQVDYHVDYLIEGVHLLSFFNKSIAQISIVEKARVCIPNHNPLTDGYCRRPDVAEYFSQDPDAGTRREHPAGRPIDPDPGEVVRPIAPVDTTPEVTTTTVPVTTTTVPVTTTTHPPSGGGGSSGSSSGSGSGSSGGGSSGGGSSGGGRGIRIE